MCFIKVYRVRFGFNEPAKNISKHGLFIIGIMAAIDPRFSQEDLNRIIQMAWEDRTPFEAIEMQFGLSESDVIRLVRASLKSSSFRMWRKRVNSGVSMKHSKKRSSEIKRFKSNRQRSIANNKISKR